MEEKNKLKISAEEIRSLIDYHKKEWKHMYSTNCYAYALGLDVPEFFICKYAYDPGTISNAQVQLTDFFSYQTLMDNILSDLDFLKIAYRFIDPNTEVEEDEWKISLLIPKIYTLELLDDFHFLRQCDDGIWYHKNGMKGTVSNLDYYDQIITNPIDCYLNDYIYTDTIGLKLKKSGK